MLRRGKGQKREIGKACKRKNTSVNILKRSEKVTFQQRPGGDEEMNHADIRLRTNAKVLEQKWA